MGTRLSLRPLFSEGNVDAQLRAQPRRETAMSYPLPAAARKDDDAYPNTGITPPILVAVARLIRAIGWAFRKLDGF
ncbi:hypothetical protein [Bradyrhizobium archetypum]|uniref:Uncharacterized protein n=1 Tax=Bradyrhizobium archetypum TaxID=2721160 RepID=A0A7Y4M399_9BRAD|nr:hypothetical protein [Bradyrhizobium archetypum]NOJ48256.1 hypothetical protein [Bradyrhizobium archetypum]